MRMIDSKMKELECSQDFSHYKSMGIFQNAQGQLTPQSLVRSGRISNSSEMLWMFSLPASMKKIRSKMKALEWTQLFPHYHPILRLFCNSTALFTLHFTHVLIKMLFTITMCCFIIFYKDSTYNYLVLIFFILFSCYKLLLDFYVHLKFSRISYLLY